MLDLTLVYPIPFAMIVAAAIFIAAEARAANRATRTFRLATVAVRQSLSRRY